MQPRRKEKEKPKARTATLTEIWAKNQQEEKARKERKRPFKKGEVVDIENELKEPFPKANVPAPRRSFGGLISTLSHTEDRSSDYTSNSKLKELGFDEEAGQTFFYPAGEMIRPYELSILKKCLANNTCISLPGAADPTLIVALTFLNFSRWFPNSIAFLCYNSFDNATHFKYICELHGYKENEVTIVATYSNFKKKENKKESFGRVIVSTPQCFQKIIESDSALLQQIRCGAVYLDDEESFSKHTKFVGALFAKGLSFRLLTIVPFVPNFSLRTAAISKRQSLITSMLITNWEESKTTDENFRRAVVPLGVTQLYWKKIDLSPSMLELISFWKKGSTPYIKEIQAIVKLPSVDIDELLNIEWAAVQKECDLLSKDIAGKCEICSFLVTAYRNLLLSGPRVFYLFCTDTLNDSNTDLAEQIQITILNTPLLQKVFEKIQENYSYNNDSPINITLNSMSLSSHIKFTILCDQIQNAINRNNLLGLSQPVRGLIICDSIHLCRAVCESLISLHNIHIVLGVNNSTAISDEYKTKVEHFKKVPSCFSIPTYNNRIDDTIVVMCFDDKKAFEAFDKSVTNNLSFIIAMGRRSLCLSDRHTEDYFVILNEEHEKLREYDGRLLQQDQNNKRKSDTGQVGAVNKYSFKYEPSRLSLNLKNTKLRFLLKTEEFEKVLASKTADVDNSSDNDSKNDSFEDPSYIKADSDDDEEKKIEVMQIDSEFEKENKSTTDDSKVVKKYDNILCKLDAMLENNSF